MTSEHSSASSPTIQLIALFHNMLGESIIIELDG
jgi:hypothetical protein